MRIAPIALHSLGTGVMRPSTEVSTTHVFTSNDVPVWTLTSRSSLDDEDDVAQAANPSIATTATTTTATIGPTRVPPGRTPARVHVLRLQIRDTRCDRCGALGSGTTLLPHGCVTA